MIGEHFEGFGSGNTEKSVVKHYFAGDKFIDPSNNNQNSSADYRNRNKRILKEFYGFFQHVSDKKACKKHRYYVKSAPYTIIPKIFH